MAKRYYWLKLKEDFFNSKPMLKLRKIAGGDTYTIIYLKMQLLSLKNEGKLYFDYIEDSFAEELALEINEDVDNVKVTLSFLEKCGLLEYASADEITLCEVPLAIGKESESTQRVRVHREKKKALQCNNDVTPCNANVIECNTEIEKEIEKESELKLELKSEKNNKVPYQQIVDMYNDTCVSLPSVKSLSDKRKRAIKARLNTYTIDDFKTVFEKTERSDFLTGRTGQWSATFDWLLNENNMIKVLEGNYDNKADKEKEIADSKTAEEEAKKQAEEEALKEHVLKLMAEGIL